jgi:hypothetical protein
VKRKRCVVFWSLVSAWMEEGNSSGKSCMIVCCWSRSPFSISHKALPDTEFGDLSDQRERQRFFQRKLDRPFRCFKFRKILLKSLYCGWCWEETDMILEYGKHNQYSLIRVSGHSPFQAFFSSRCCSTNTSMYFAQFLLSTFRGRFDIIGNASRIRFFCDYNFVSG